MFEQWREILEETRPEFDDDEDYDINGNSRKSDHGVYLPLVMDTFMAKLRPWMSYVNNTIIIFISFDYLFLFINSGINDIHQIEMNGM